MILLIPFLTICRAESWGLIRRENAVVNNKGGIRFSLKTNGKAADSETAL